MVTLHFTLTMTPKHLFLLLLCHTGWSMMVARCPKYWQDRGGTDQCYLIHSGGRARSFYDARTYCKAHGGDFAFIDTVSMREWLSLAVAEVGDIGQYAYMWVGAKYSSNAWQWVGTGEPINSTVVPFMGTGTGNCAAFTVDSKLIKQNCSQELKFICHRNITIPPPCDYDDGWEEMYQSCFKKSAQKKSWHDGQVECKIDNGNLITVWGITEQQLVTDFAFDVQDNVWIGFTEEGHAGNFRWISGGNSTYINWGDNQPDLSLHGYGAAVIDENDENGRWVVQKITNMFHYMCKKQQGACLPGWEQFQDSCYYFNTEATDKVVWEDAKSICEAVGASMIVLDTDEENKFIFNHIMDIDNLWIGLYSVPNDTVYWTDGSTMDSKNYTYMENSDRDNALKAKDQQCVFFQKLGDPGKMTPSWVPTDCHDPRHYVCEVGVGDPINLLPPDNKRYCAEGWEQSNDHCYFFSTDEQTWSSAASVCSANDAKLASIVTWAEQDFIFDHQRSESWVGLNDRLNEGTYVWSDGSKLTITNWNNGEPTGTGENCVQIKADTGKWNDNSCDQKLTFSCKKKASITPIDVKTTTIPTQDPTACGWDWTENPETGECYRLELRELTFSDARSVCQELPYDSDQSSPDVVSLYSSEEQTFIYNQLLSQHLSQNMIWLGMKNDIDGNRWLDGTPVAYYNWEDGEPNGYYTEDCVNMYLEDGKWNDMNCEERMAFVCEKKGRNYVGPQPPPTPEVRCPAGWTYWDNHCYYYSDKQTTWDLAHSACNENFGSELVSVISKDEDDYLQQVLTAQSKNIWLGLHDDNNGHNWHWVDGTPMGFTNWYPGEPNNQGGIEHCGEKRTVDYTYAGTWNDMPCSSENYYVCKITVTTCPQTWTLHEGKCYFASNYEITWHEARDKCQEFNTKADLISIHSEEDNNFFTTQLTQRSPATWLGLTYNSTYQKWSWSDGQVNNYTNWNGGEPNNLYSEWCTECIDYPGDITDGKWNNLDCTQSRAFGCELFPTHVVGCDDGWMGFDKYCYWYNDPDYVYLSATYSDARSDCQSKGGDLVSIHSAEENDFVVALTSTYDSSWIGMTGSSHEGSFQWADDTSITYTNWEFLYNSVYSTDSSCATFDYLSSDGEWKLQDCDFQKTYICKKVQEARPINPSNKGCNAGDEVYRGSCYNFPDVQHTWSDAEADCESRGAHLMVLNDRFENSYTSAFLGDLGSWVWIGLSGKTEASGSVSFSWVNGDTAEFTNWDEYEPDPDHGTCVASSGKKTNLGFWTVTNCDDEYRYICEYDRSGYTTPTPPTTLPPTYFCADGWTRRGESCYQVYPQASSWGDGEKYCAAFSGHLTSIGSDAEEAIIKLLPGMTDIKATYNSVWVGLKLGSDSGYEWIDGTPNDFVNWAEGQPDSYQGKESCGSADISDLKLSDDVCDAYLPFICEAAVGTMVTTMAPPTRGPDVMCDDDPSWYLYEGYCYKFVSLADEDTQSWWESHRLCRDIGGELVSIHTYDENYWIESKINSLSDSILWIGGRAKLDSGYEWTDRSAFDYDNWAKGEPNNDFAQEDCIGMYNHQQGYWNDENCGLTHGRICRRLYGQTLPPPETTKIPAGECIESWLHTGSKCIKSFKQKQNLTLARASCKGLGHNVDLVSIHSSGEQAYLTALLGAMQEDLWLGMQNNGKFVWLDQSSVTYTNWAPGEPNGGESGDICVVASYATGQWSDVHCSNVYGYVCMMKQDPDQQNHHPPPTCNSPFSNYIAYNGACYKSHNSTKSWKDAETACVSEGAHLASVNDLSEDGLMWVLIQEGAISDAWIGLNNLQDKQVYKWSDGWPTIYTNWDNGQLNVSITNNNCVRIKSVNGHWTAEECDDARPFICKYKNGTVPTPDPSHTGHCPNTDWLDLGGSYCYLIYSQPKIWSDANMFCLQKDASLVSIHSSEEMGLITMATKNTELPLWIGLVQKGDDFGWSDESGYNFMYWQDGQPSNIEEQCTEANPTTGRWNDAICSNQRSFICKTLKIQEPTNPPPPTAHTTTTNTPGGGGDSGIDAGGVAGIVVAVLFVMVAVSFVGYSYIQKSRKPAGDGASHSFDNVLYSGGDIGAVNVNETYNSSDA